MCAYNRINGTYASEHATLLTDILRDEWGFEGGGLGLGCRPRSRARWRPGSTSRCPGLGLVASSRSWTR